MSVARVAVDCPGGGSPLARPLLALSFLPLPGGALPPPPPAVLRPHRTPSGASLSCGAWRCRKPGTEVVMQAPDGEAGYDATAPFGGPPGGYGGSPHDGGGGGYGSRQSGAVNGDPLEPSEPYLHAGRTPAEACRSAEPRAADGLPANGEEPAGAAPALASAPVPGSGNKALAHLRQAAPQPSAPTRAGDAELEASIAGYLRSNATVGMPQIGAFCNQELHCKMTVSEPPPPLPGMGPVLQHAETCCAV